MTDTTKKVQLSDAEWDEIGNLIGAAYMVSQPLDRLLVQAGALIDRIVSARVPCVECGDHRGWIAVPDPATGDAVQEQCRSCHEHRCEQPIRDAE